METGTGEKVRVLQTIDCVTRCPIECGVVDVHRTMGCLFSQEEYGMNEHERNLI
jgi:hypothetical protein